MGDDPPHRLGSGRVSTQGRVMDHGEAAPAAIGRVLGLTSAGNCDVGSMVQKYGGVCAEEAECSHAMHHDATDSVPLQGDGKEARDVGGKKVVGTGGPGPGGSKGGDSRRIEGRGRAGERGGGVAGN